VGTEGYSGGQRNEPGLGGPDSEEWRRRSGGGEVEEEKWRMKEQCHAACVTADSIGLWK